MDAETLDAVIINLILAVPTGVSAESLVRLLASSEIASKKEASSAIRSMLNRGVLDLNSDLRLVHAAGRG